MASLVLWNDCFNFFSCNTDDNRKKSLGLVMEEKFGPVLLKEDEKAYIKAEYVPLLINAMALNRKPRSEFSWKNVAWTFDEWEILQELWY